MSMISELIEELIDNADLYTKELHDLMYRAADTIEMLSEKAREPKQREWIPCNRSGLPLTEMMRRDGQKWYGYKCSNCNFIYKGNALVECNFCPNCGSRMKGADDD